MDMVSWLDEVLRAPVLTCPAVCHSWVFHMGERSSRKPQLLEDYLQEKLHIEVKDLEIDCSGEYLFAS